VYFQVTDSHVHALVGCGTHHGIDAIQYFKCQACGTKVTGRWNTPMYDLKTAACEVGRVMTAILVIRCGGRTRMDAQLFVHEVWSRLAPGTPPVFTTDGLQQYYYALTAHFGHWVTEVGKRCPVWQVDPRLLYGQLHKITSGYTLKYMYTQALCGTRAELRNALQSLDLTGKIMTAYIERVNLTLREHIAPLSRRTWSLAQDEHSLWMHIEWGRAYYHFCRYHEALRVPAAKPRRYRSRTPAKAVGLARRRWRVSDLLLMPPPPA